MNYITGIFAALLSVLLLFMYPLYEQARSQDKIANLVVQAAVTRFVDSARTKGYITPQMYETFNAQLAATGNPYEVRLEHLRKRYVPEYGDPADPSTFKNRFTAFYDGFYNEQILAVLFPNLISSADDPARRYDMQVGDYIGIKLENVNRTAAVQLWDFLMNDNTDENATVAINYEGMVLNEDR